MGSVGWAPGVASASTPFDSGKKTVKVEPRPGSLATWISPPRSPAIFREMVSPSPVPPYLRVVAASACWNSSTSPNFPQFPWT